MGCANSKQSSSSRSKCKHCQSPLSPQPRRSYSTHVHHPPQVQGDTCHVVALTSTTLGSLKLETTVDTKNSMCNRVNGYATITNGDVVDQRGVGGGGGGDVWDNKHSIKFSLGVIEAKTWSEMISEKIPKVLPKTPTRTPPGEPETINTWELMEGLDDLSPLRPANHLRSFSFDVVPSNRSHDSFDRPKSRLQDNGLVSPKQLEKTALADNDLSSAKPQQQNSWDYANDLLHEMENDNPNSKVDSVISDFDPDVISTFRKSLEDLSPNIPFYLRWSSDNDKPPLTTTITTDKTLLDVTNDYKRIPYPKVKDKMIIYFTSLRGIRKTYEDCCLVRVIIKGFNVRVDERDVSMHSGFKDELKELLGDLQTGVGLNLPRVFVGQKYIGGAEDIRKLNEEGKLEKMFECCEKLDDDDGDENARRRVCDACGDVRFVPCETCSGSCKIYFEGGGSGYESEDKSNYSEKEDDGEDDEKEQEDEEEDVEYGFRRCPDCNENGLIRCPMCCD